MKDFIKFLIYYGYLAIMVLLPIIYLIMYKKKKSKHKKWGKAFVIAIIIFILMASIKVIIYFADDTRLNCVFNRICETKKEDTEDDETINTTSTNSTTTSTIKTSTTTTKKPVTYDKIPEPSGEKKVIGKSSKGYDIYSIDGVTYIDGYLIANKTYPLPETFVPKNTKATTNDPTKVCNNCINIQVYNAFEVMKADAQAAGIKLWNQSGYRSFTVQGILYNNYINKEMNKGLSYLNAKAEADTYSARPGYSEHQSGECFDLNNAGRNFNGTEAAKWVDQNASKYGFIIRYPEGKTNETGYIYESWHLRYVGEELANVLYNNGDWITMETYFGITSKYNE